MESHISKDQTVHFYVEVGDTPWHFDLDCLKSVSQFVESQHKKNGSSCSQYMYLSVCQDLSEIPQAIVLYLFMVF